MHSVPILSCGWKRKAPHSDINVFEFCEIKYMLKTESCGSTSDLKLQCFYYAFGSSINLLQGVSAL